MEKLFGTRIQGLFQILELQKFKILASHFLKSFLPQQIQLLNSCSTYRRTLILESKKNLRN